MTKVAKHGVWKSGETITTSGRKHKVAQRTEWHAPDGDVRIYALCHKNQVAAADWLKMATRAARTDGVKMLSIEIVKLVEGPPPIK